MLKLTLETYEVQCKPPFVTFGLAPALDSFVLFFFLRFGWSNCFCFLQGGVEVGTLLPVVLVRSDGGANKTGDRILRQAYRKRHVSNRVQYNH